MAPLNSFNVNSDKGDLMGSPDSVVEVGWRQDNREEEEGDDDGDDDDSPLTFFDERNNLLEFTTTGFDALVFSSPNTTKTRDLRPKTTKTTAETTTLCEVGNVIVDDNKEKENIEELRKQLQQMQIQLQQLELDKKQQTRRANELEQILNGYESNDPKEYILTKELELADANMKIELLQTKVTKLEEENQHHQQQQNNNNSQQQQQQGGGGLGERRFGGGLTTRITRQRSFRHSSTNNNNNNNRNNFMIQKSKSFRWSPRNINKDTSSSSTTTTLHNEKSIIGKKNDDDDDSMLKSLLSQLRQMENQKFRLEKKCQSQQDTIQELRNNKLRGGVRKIKSKEDYLDNDDDDDDIDKNRNHRCRNSNSNSNSSSNNNNNNNKVMLNHSLHQKIMQTQVSALEEERNEFAHKCQLQEKIIKEFKLKEADEKEASATAAETNKKQQQPQKQQNDDVDPMMVVSLHRSILQTQIDALEEEKIHYQKKCITKDTNISSLKEENKLLKVKIEMLEQIMVVVGEHNNPK